MDNKVLNKQIPIKTIVDIQIILRNTKKDTQIYFKKTKKKMKN